MEKENNMADITIAVDHGNSQIKTPTFCFPSGLTEHGTRPPLAEALLEISGRFYTPTRPTFADYLRDKTEGDRFWRLTLCAIGRELERIGRSGKYTAIDLAVGLPPGHFKQVGLREKFNKYFRREELTEFVYNGRTYQVSVEDVSVFPQCYAAAIGDLSEIKDESIFYIVDIGGMTADVMRLRSGVLDLSMLKSLDFGTLTAFGEIAEAVDAAYYWKIEEADIRNVAENRATPLLPDEVIQMIRAGLRDYTDRLLRQLTMGGVNLKAARSLFVGGGAALCKPYIAFPGCNFNTDVHANAKGYQKMAEIQKNRDARTLAHGV
jgi:plasmid segregation protein ParM